MTTVEERIVSELKELAWDHHAPFEDRLNDAANHLRNYGEMDTRDLTELKLIVLESMELAQRVAKVLKAVGENGEECYAV